MGRIFLWTGERGRPEAAIQVFLLKNKREPQGLWIHEFTSLAASTLTATRSGRPWWSPRVPGLELKPLPGRPNRPISRGAADPPDAAPWPIVSAPRTISAKRAGPSSGCFRLRSPDTASPRLPARRSALFAFVLGTDPEVFLFLEVRPAKEGPSGSMPSHR